jgi:hypothetical protein
MLISAPAFGEVRVRQLMVGTALVALAVGWFVGRRVERVGRSRRDVTSAKATLEKAAKIAAGELRKVITAVIVVGVILTALFLASMHSNN